METDIVVEPSKSEPGKWYWAFTVGGEVYAAGTEGNAVEARRKARMARREWEDRDR